MREDNQAHHDFEQQPVVREQDGPYQVALWPVARGRQQWMTKLAEKRFLLGRIQRASKRCFLLGDLGLNLFRELADDVLAFVSGRKSLSVRK